MKINYLSGQRMEGRSAGRNTFNLHLNQLAPSTISHPSTFARQCGFNAFAHAMLDFYYAAGLTNLIGPELGRGCGQDGISVDHLPSASEPETRMYLARQLCWLFGLLLASERLGSPFGFPAGSCTFPVPSGLQLFVLGIGQGKGSVVAHYKRPWSSSTGHQFPRSGRRVNTED